MTQAATDQANAVFWDELCGSIFARDNGVTDNSPESVAKFDRAYFDFYPYLASYVPAQLDGERALEIGLGYGTLGQLIAERGADYNGLDIAAGPVGMMRARLERLGLDDLEGRVVQGSALEIPHEDDSLDRVFAIGCLHHTGDLRGAIGEVHRVLRPGGTAVVMFYNRRSARRGKLWLRGLPSRVRGSRDRHEAAIRRRYDPNSSGGEAPATEFASLRETREMFSPFGSSRIVKENFDHIGKAPLIVPRLRLLGWPAHLWGLDLYVTAVK